MVIGLHLPLPSSLLDGMSARIQSVDSETVPSVSFGEILKSKEKQLQEAQSVSASSVVAALANLQALLMTKQSSFEIETVDTTARVDTQPSSQAAISDFKTQPINTFAFLDHLPQLAATKTLTTDQSLALQARVGKPVPAELPAFVSYRSQNGPAESPEIVLTKSASVSLLEVGTTNFTNIETTTPFTYKDSPDQTSKTTGESAVQVRIPQVTIHQAVPKSVPEPATQWEKPAAATKNVELQVHTTESSVGIAHATVGVNTISKTEDVLPGPKLPTSDRDKILPESPVGNSLQPQVEINNIHWQVNTISQSMNASNSLARDALIIDKAESKETYASTSAKTTASTVQMADANPVPQTTAQSKADEGTTSFILGPHEEPVVELQQRGATNSPVNVSIDHETEKIVPPVSVQTKTVATASIQSEIKLALPRTEAVYENPVAENPTVEITANKTLQSRIIAESLNEVIENTEPYPIKAATQVPVKEIISSNGDAHSYQEIDVDAHSPIFNAGAADVPMNREENFITSPSTPSETTAENVAQITPEVDLSAAKANPETIDVQAVAPHEEAFLPGQTREDETESLTTKNIDAGKVVSQTILQTKVDETRHAQTLPGVHSATEIKSPERVFQNIEQQSNVEVNSVTRNPIMEEDNAGRTTLLKKAVTPSITATGNLLNPTEDFAVVSPASQMMTNTYGAALTESTAGSYASDILENPYIGNIESRASTPVSNTIAFRIKSGNDSEINEVQIAVSQAEENTASVNLPAIDPLDARTNVESEGFRVTPEPIKSETNTATLTAESSQSVGEPSDSVDDWPALQTINKCLDLEAQTVLLSEKGATILDKTKLDSMQARMEIEQETPILKTKLTLAQERAETPSTEVQNLTGKTAAFIESVSMAGKQDMAADRAIIQKHVSRETLQSPDNVLITQTIAEPNGLSLEPMSVEPQVNTAKLAEKIVTDQVNADRAETEHLRTESTTQTDTSAKSVSEAQVLEDSSEAVEIKKAQKQINVGEQEFPAVQSATKSVEKTEVTNVANAGKSNEKSVVVETKNFIDDRTTFVNEVKTVADQVPLSPTSNNEFSAFSQPGISMKVENSKPELKVIPAVSKDKELPSSEKQPKQSQMLESAAVSQGPIKEAITIEQNINAHASQVIPQAAEVAQQVIRQINVRLKNGPASMHLTLNPKELGAIDVEMVSTSQGVRVTFFAEQTSTGKLLETQLNQLRESLIDSGVQLSSLNTGQHGLSEQKGGFSHNTDFIRNSAREVTQNEKNHTEVSETERNIGQSGEVDYRI